MELLLPNLGLIVWTTLAFVIVFVLLAKFAWKPILKSIHERETFIETSLQKAKEAETNLLSINEKTNQLLKEAQAEKQKIIADGQTLKQQIISEAQEKAKAEATKIIAAAKADGQKNQEKIMHDIKQNIAELVIATTEKILKEKLKPTKEQEKMIEKAIADISAN